MYGLFRIPHNFSVEFKSGIFFSEQLHNSRFLLSEPFLGGFISVFLIFYIPVMRFALTLGQRVAHYVQALTDMMQRCINSCRLPCPRDSEAPQMHSVSTTIMHTLYCRPITLNLPRSHYSKGLGPDA